MKGQTKAGWKVTAVLLASAVAAFGQANYISQQPPQAPYANAPAPYDAAPQQPAQVGPGTINYLEGQVSVDGRPVSPGSARNAALIPGQVLETGSGFAELLLTPGAFLRVGHNSEVHMLAVGLADTTAQLTRGTALIEVDDLIKGTNLAVEMNGSTIRIEKKGLYDFDANQQAVKVLDGKASVTEASGTKTLGKGHEVLLASAHPLKSRGFDKNSVEGGQLYVWSRARSEDEAQANASEENLAALNGASYAPGWYWNPYWDFYAWMSPYGYMYSPFGLGFYSPFFYGGYYAPLYRGWHAGHVHGFAGGVRGFHGFHGGGFHTGGFHGSGFHGAVGGFHGGGFHGGGFHGGGHR